MPSTAPDFLTATELAKLIGVQRKTVYAWSSSGTGPLVSILVKVGGRLGAWRSDYQLWRDAQLKLKPPAPDQRGAA